MSHETDRRVSLPEINGEFPTKELSQRTRVIRTNNPLVTHLLNSGNYFQRFTEITNDLIDARGGIPIEPPRVEMIKVGNNQAIDFTITTITHEGRWAEETRESIRNLLRSLYQTKTLQEGGVPLPRKATPKSLYITTGVEDYKKGSGDRIVGFVLKGALEDDPKEADLEIRSDAYNENPLEVDSVYETVMSSLIIAGKIDLSSEQALEETFPFRKSLYLHIYHELLEEMMPFAKREEIHGLDDQIADIETNLYGPLRRRNGNPMNTLLTGAPGVGKTFVGSYFASQKDVLTVPLPVEYLQNFEHYVAPRLSRVKEAFDVPIVVLVEDVEGLLESAISIDSSGGMQQYIDPQRRSQALSLLERLQDTYKMYLMCSLNHPDVEAAFLRRLNTLYFPLPTEGQRSIMLNEVIDASRFPEGDHQRVVGGFLEMTEGFNYSGLSLIGEYVANIELANGDHRLEGEEYENALKVALSKSKSRLSKAGLVRFDQAARKMVGLEEQDIKIPV